MGKSDELICNIERLNVSIVLANGERMIVSINEMRARNKLKLDTSMSIN